jgi:hypothetical protein
MCQKGLFVSHEICQKGLLLVSHEMCQKGLFVSHECVRKDYCSGMGDGDYT